MKNTETLFYDSTTKTYFKSNFTIIREHINDMIKSRTDDVRKGCREYWDSYEDTTYVKLIRDFQNRLGIPTIVDENLCRVYGMYDGCRLNVGFNIALMEDGTWVSVINYRPI